ncbi:MAG: hypothetical protein JWP89_2812 [Schlesneria sp.]|nr:hypothetical protein [Schlesneria sp.]
MSLPSFLHSLLGEGRVRVESVFKSDGRLLTESPQELNESFKLLSDFDREYRLELAHKPPELSRAALLWGAIQVRRAASLLTYREAEPEQLQAALTGSFAETISASVVYSVDLTYRFLPDLLRLARAASPQDPLVAILKDWANQWPLSSVGVADVSVTGSLEWLDDPCLRHLYVDRILAEQDASRLADSRTLEAVRIAVGGQSHLVAKLAAVLSAK